MSPRAASTASVPQPPKSFNRIRPSSSSRIERDGARSSCAGQRASHRPGAACLTRSKRSSSLAAAVMPNLPLGRNSTQRAARLRRDRSPSRKSKSGAGRFLELTRFSGHLNVRFGGVHDGREVGPVHAGV